MDPAFTPDMFTHARVIIGIVTGFSMARLLNGVAQLIQRPAPDPGAGRRIAWASFLLLWVTQFWWFELGPGPETGWGFGLYLFTIAYAALFFFGCAILFPDRPGPQEVYSDCFRTHRAWFYGLLAGLFVADAVFSAIKGAEHLRALGAVYLGKQVLLSGLALAAIPAWSARLDGAVAAFAIVLQLAWILRILGRAL